MQRIELPNDVIDHIPVPGSERLVVPFAPLATRPRADDWYRGRDLLEWFAGPVYRGILGDYGAHSFYGVSMGGYGACAFCAPAPGVTVVAFVPQSTLDPAKVPWERRYVQGMAQDWTGPWADAQESIGTASRAVVVYDPFDGTDRYLDAARYLVARAEAALGRTEAAIGTLRELQAERPGRRRARRLLVQLGGRA